MASTLKINTLTGVTTAGSIAVTGEGNSTTTNLQQGLCKQWVAFDMTDQSIGDSFNTTSVTDVSSGNSLVTIANDFANIHYAMGVSGTNSSNGNAFVSMSGVTPTVTTYRLGGYLSNDTNMDIDQVKSICSGDLA